MLARFPAIVYAIAMVFSPLRAIAQTCGVSIPATIVDATTGNFIPSVQPAMVHARVKKTFVSANDVLRIKNFRVIVLEDVSGSMSSMDVGSFSNQRAAV